MNPFRSLQYGLLIISLFIIFCSVGKRSAEVQEASFARRSAVIESYWAIPMLPGLVQGNVSLRR